MKSLRYPSLKPQWFQSLLGFVRHADFCLSTDMVTQALELSNQPHVVVATPGRLADHIRSSNTFSMAKIQFLVRRTTHRASTYCFSVKERQSLSPGCGGAQFLSFPAALFGRSWMRQIDCWNKAAQTSPKTWRRSWLLYRQRDRLCSSARHWRTHCRSWSTSLWTNLSSGRASQSEEDACFTVPTNNQKMRGQRKKLLLEEYLDFLKNFCQNRGMMHSVYEFNDETSA